MADVELGKQLREEPYRFNFFQAVRILERIATERCELEPGYRRLPIGEDHPPNREIVRFRAAPSHSFPPGDIASINPRVEGKLDDADSPPAEMVVGFMGMTGPAGVLPQHYTQLVIDRIRQKDVALRDWLDLFNHRTISLFYRVWEKYRFPFSYERTALAEGAGADLFTRGVYCLVGWGTGALRNRLAFGDESFLYYAGHFAHYPRTAVSLQRMVADYFEVPLEVQQFVGQWLYLSEEDQTCMPSDEHPEGKNNQLGLTAVVGERVWGVESKFRLRLGPLDYRQFRRFSPLGDRLVPLCQLVRSYVGPELDFDIQVVLRAEEVPPCRPGPRTDSDPSHLGWNTWLSSRPFSTPAEEAIFYDEGLPTRENPRRGEAAIKAV